MKTNSAELLTALNSEDLGFFFLVRLDFNNVYFLTTLPYDFPWNGNLYGTEDSIISFEAPRATTTVDRQTYKLKLSALSDEMSGEVEAGIVNKPVTIRLGLIVDGVPQDGLDELIHVYSGFVSSVTQDISDSEQSFLLECSAPLSNLDAKSTMFTTRDGMRSFSDTDTSFDQIFEGSTEYSIKWGKN